MNAGLGPMQGQANHFYRYAPEKIPYGINRYVNETKRLYSVLEKHFEKNSYLVDDKYTVADMSTFSWYVQIICSLRTYIAHLNHNHNNHNNRRNCVLVRDV